jgi:hypothetical protein
MRVESNLTLLTKDQQAFPTCFGCVPLERHIPTYCDGGDWFPGGIEVLVQQDQMTRPWR